MPFKKMYTSIRIFRCCYWIIRLKNDFALYKHLSLNKRETKNFVFSKNKYLKSPQGPQPYKASRDVEKQ